MNRAEAKQILLLYRTPADAQDPQIAGALALAKTDAELARWFDEFCATQNALREKFRQIGIPAALKEQIISEQISNAKAKARRDKLVAAGAIGAIVAALIVLAMTYFPSRENGNAPAPTLANYQSQMLYFAQPGYGMDLATNDLAEIKNYFRKNKSLSDYVLPAPLAQTAATGCAVRNWNDARVSMICFATGKPLPKNLPGDLWLFVVDRATIKDAPDSAIPQLSQIGGIAVATWTQNGKFYLLGVQGDEQTLRKYL